MSTHRLERSSTHLITNWRVFKIITKIKYDDPWAEDYGRLKTGLWPRQYRANRSWKNTRSHQYR